MQTGCLVYFAMKREMAFAEYVIVPPQDTWYSRDLHVLRSNPSVESLSDTGNTTRSTACSVAKWWNVTLTCQTW